MSFDFLKKMSPSTKPDFIKEFHRMEKKIAGRDKEIRGQKQAIRRLKKDIRNLKKELLMATSVKVIE